MQAARCIARTSTRVSRPLSARHASANAYARPRTRPLESHPAAIAFSIAVLGIGGYAAYRFVSPFFAWPAPIRIELRLAVTCELNRDFYAAEAQYRKAWDLARSMMGSLGREPLLHTTGIAARLGALLEGRLQYKEAAKVYKQAYDEIRAVPDPSPRLRARAVSLAVKYAELANDLPTIEWAAAEVLRLASVPEHRHADTQIGLLHLPRWTHQLDVGALFETLGIVYLRNDVNDLAVPAFLQALSTLTPAELDFDGRCRQAIIMNSIATASSTADTIAAKAWARKSLATSRAALDDAKRANKRRSTGDCRECEVAALFNLASLLETEGDRRQAMRFFEESLDLAQMYGLAKGTRESQKALDRVESVPLQ